ncbi:hypothetical protein FKM82_023364, partial [Ascaphus truei]
MAVLNTLDRWINETPPMDQPSRFGNKAFRTWYAKLDQEAENLVSTLIPPQLNAAVPEVALYLKESVGNSTRIDYGTGKPRRGQGRDCWYRRAREASCSPQGPPTG